MKFFLVSTDHLTERLWFRDEDDFKVGMNYVAIVSFLTGVNVLAFILMSNHVHFVLECSEEKAKEFIDLFKKLYGQYFNRKYGFRKAFHRIGVDIRLIDTGNESLERVIAYVIMNCVAANICLSSTDYPWGSGPSFFRASPREGKRLCEFSLRSQSKILHSKVKLPEDYMVSHDGYILPESYLKVKFVETIFRTPKRMNYFLMNSSKAKRTKEMPENGLPTFRDQIIMAAMVDLCRSLYGKNTVEELNDEEKGNLVTQIRRRFSSDINQISRVTGIPLSDATDMLDRFR